MGIQGLLQALKPLIEITHISTLKGKRVAIDGYCWLHKAVYGCALELCLKQQSDLWIKYCLSYIDLLLQHGIQVTIVFDGAPLPAKQKTEEEREENRQKNMQIAKDYYSKNDLKNARNYFARAIDITPQMAAELIQVVESSRPSVKFLVSPHEADAQLAFLSRNELVDVIITEDSDTIAYGCKDIVFKLNRDGSCERLIVNDVFTKFIDSKFDLRTFTPEMFLAMCIFSGCDYLESLPGIGLKTSYKMMVKHRDEKNMLKAMRLNGILPLVTVPLPSSNSESSVLEYELKFYEAWTTFHHQVVFDPRTKRTVNLTPINMEELPNCVRSLYGKELESIGLNGNNVSLPFLGTLLSVTEACDIAFGKMDPITKVRFQLDKQFHPVLENRNTVQTRPPPVHFKGSNAASKGFSFKRSSSDSITIIQKFQKISSNQTVSTTRTSDLVSYKTQLLEKSRPSSAPVLHNTPTASFKKQEAFETNVFLYENEIVSPVPAHTNTQRKSKYFSGESFQKKDSLTSEILSNQFSSLNDSFSSDINSPFTSTSGFPIYSVFSPQSSKDQTSENSLSKISPRKNEPAEGICELDSSIFDLYSFPANSNVGPFSIDSSKTIDEDLSTRVVNKVVERQKNNKLGPRLNSIKNYFRSTPSDISIASLSDQRKKTAHEKLSTLVDLSDDNSQDAINSVPQQNTDFYSTTVEPPSSSKINIFQRYSLNT